jgi:hypothetical protein
VCTYRYYTNEESIIHPAQCNNTSSDGSTPQAVGERARFSFFGYEEKITMTEMMAKKARRTKLCFYFLLKASHAGYAGMILSLAAT